MILNYVLPPSQIRILGFLFNRKLKAFLIIFLLQNLYHLPLLGKRYLIDYQTRCIRIVNYISDGRILNSTIWHSSPFDPNNSNNLSYGILVDADSNKKTGYQGIDYKMELTWKNGSWYRILSELSSRGQQRILENSSFLDLHNTKKAYIDLSLDLNSIIYPQNTTYHLMCKERLVILYLI